MRVVVVGGGSWGTAFASLLHHHGHEVTLACRDAAQVRAIVETGRNPRYLQRADLDGVAAATAEDAPLEEAELLVVAVPSGAFGAVAGSLPGEAPVLSLAKGLDPESGDRLSTLVKDRAVAVLSGPNFAEEIARGLPAAAVVASVDPALSRRLQHALHSLSFRIYVNDDLVGVELAAAAKNVIALAAGGSDGLGLGDNAKSAVITRGLAEMSRLGEACGGRAETFSGLAGLGDLVATCWSRLSRNRRAGELLAQGMPPDQVVAEIGSVVEGLTTAPALARLAQRYGVEMPITDGVCNVLQKNGGPRELVSTLMGRQPTEE
jgi:glycerol-3-phosphate dehydrogenase (NAD(P)+)